jgi:hypothetical protein
MPESSVLSLNNEPQLLSQASRSSFQLFAVHEGAGHLTLRDEQGRDQQ